jgi:hypothetical protein
MPQLKPYRHISEYEVINDLFACDTIPSNKGTLVKITNGWDNDDEMNLIGSVGASYAGTVSERWGVSAKVEAAGTGDTVLGMLLHDVKEVDENGLPLKFFPEKAAEMQVALSGQPVPIVTRGVVLYSGITGAVSAGDALYVDDNGVINHLQKFTAQQVGRALGSKDDQGYALIQIQL